MSDELEDLKSRLVIGHKRDGRCVYDEAAKTELVMLCLRPGASISRLARECGVNANQVNRWLREHGQPRRPRAAVKGVAAPVPAPFVAVPIVPSPPIGSPQSNSMPRAEMSVQARLPNGVEVDLRGIEPRQLAEVIKMLGSVRCSALTKD